MAAWPTIADLQTHMGRSLAADQLAVAQRALDAATDWIARRLALYELDADGAWVEDEAGDPVPLATVPAPVAQAILLYAAKLYRRKDTPDGLAGTSDIGLIRTGRFDSDAEALLEPFITPGIA